MKSDALNGVDEMYHSLSIETFASNLKRAAKTQRRLSRDDKQSLCLARIAQHAGYHSWPSLVDKMSEINPAQKVPLDIREAVHRGLPKAIPLACEYYVRLDAIAALQARFTRMATVNALKEAGLDHVDVYEEVLAEFDGMLPKAILSDMAVDLERMGVWGAVPEDIIIDEFYIGDWE